MAKRGKKSGVPRELERSGALCLAFANTGVPRRDDRRRDSKAPPSMASTIFFRCSARGASLPPYSLRASWATWWWRT